MQQTDFAIIDLPNHTHGILKQIGERKVVVNYELLDGADTADNDWLGDQLMLVYQQYYHRVKSYKQDI